MKLDKKTRKVLLKVYPKSWIEVLEMDPPPFDIDAMSDELKEWTRNNITQEHLDALKLFAAIHHRVYADIIKAQERPGTTHIQAPKLKQLETQLRKQGIKPL
jgi:hypothetical protein